MKLGFTGTQRGMTQAQLVACAKVLDEFQPTEARHGDCIGADDRFDLLCHIRKIQTVIHPPLNPSKRAWCFRRVNTGTRAMREEMPLDYIERNHAIVDASDMLLATPGETVEQLRSGTWATIRYARKRGGRVVIIVWPDGTWTPEGHR